MNEQAADFQTFRAAYRKTLLRFLTGYGEEAAALGAMQDAHPEWVEMIDNETEGGK